MTESLDQILEGQNIDPSSIKDYEHYAMIYRVMQAVLKHQKSSPETLNKIRELDDKISAHVKSEDIWKTEMISSMSEINDSIREMSPTVREIKDVGTFFSVARRVGLGTVAVITFCGVIWGAFVGVHTILTRLSRP